MKSYQSERQARDPSFTRSRFCKELGLPNTRSYFNDIVKGTRNITDNYVERFVHVLSLTHDEAAYFRILVFFGQSTYEKELAKILGNEMTLKPWRRTAMHDELKNRLCLKSHKRFLKQSLG